MPQIIDIPQIGRVEFPDGMKDADIVSAIRKMQPAQPSSPADGIGAAESALIAAGRGTDKIVQGVRQLYNRATGDQATLDKMASDEAEKDRLYSPLAAAHPIATSIGEAVPSMAVPLAGPGGLLVRSAVTGAIPAAMSYGTDEQRAVGALKGAVGGAVGAGVGAGVARLLKPAGVGTEALSSTAQAAADRLGVKLSAAERSQNPAMMGFENYLSKSPGSSGAMQAAQAAKQQALNNAALKSMGQPAGDLGEGAFSTAKAAIGSEFQRLQSITAPQLGTDFFTTLAQIDSANAARGSFKSSTIDGLVDKGLDLAAKGKLTGTAYKEIRTQLSNEADSAFKSGDATLGQAYKALRSSLDDAAKASLPKAEQEAWDTTRKQWQAYKLLTKSNVSEAGNVSAPRLAAAMRGQGDGLRTGAAKGELADIARLGEAVKGVSNPNSGQLAQQMMYGNPITGLPMVAGNWAAGALYRRPAVQNYMANGLLDVGEGGRRALTVAGRPVGIGLLSNYLGAQ